MTHFHISSYRPSVCTVTARLIEERIDASYYKADHLELVGQLSHVISCVALSTFYDVTKLSGFEFTNHFTAQEMANGVVPCVMSENVRANELDLTQCKRITKATHQLLTRSQLAHGNIVLSYTGHYRRAAVVPKGLGDLHLGPNVCKVTLKPSKQCDTYFLSTYLNSSFGQRCLDREKTISAQPTVNMERIRSLLVPDVDYAAQRYIGDKLRLAERLRQLARNRETGFGSLIKDAYPQIDSRIPFVVKHSRAKPGELDGTLNPGAFNPDRVYVRSILSQSGGKRLHEFARIETPVTSEYQPTDLYFGLDSIGSSCGTLVPSTIEKEEVVGSVRVLGEGPAISKLRPYLNKVAYIPSELAGSFGSTELLCVRCEDPLLKWYAYGVLHLESTVRQLNPVSTGSTHPRVTRDDVLDVIVPWISDPHAAGQLLKNAQRSYFASDRLVGAAKVLVEALVQGKLTEAELSHAHLRLEQGDTDPDRAIFARLYEGGIDATSTKRLVLDLDAHYEAIRQLEEAEPVEEAV